MMSMLAESVRSTRPEQTLVADTGEADRAALYVTCMRPPRPNIMREIEPNVRSDLANDRIATPHKCPFR